MTQQPSVGGNAEIEGLDNAAVQSQITVTEKNIILQEKLKTNFFLHIKCGMTYASDAAVSVFVLIHCFKLYINCHSDWSFFAIKFGRDI